MEIESNYISHIWRFLVDVLDMLQDNLKNFWKLFSYIPFTRFKGIYESLSL